MNILKLILKAIFIWGKPSPKGDPYSAELIVVHAMSDLKEGKTSETNYRLAQLARCYHEELKLPIFPQAEVGKPLNEWGIPTVGSTPSDSNTGVFSAQYAGTIGVARLQKEMCREKKWNRVLVIAPWPHAWRAIWVYEKLGLEAVIPPNLPSMHFQLEMTQKRWRRPITAYPYELLARMLYLFRGYI